MIEIIGYKKQYKKTSIQLENHSSSKRIILIKGANGSGKTTVLKSMAKLNHYTGTLRVLEPSYYSEEEATFPEAMRVHDYLSALLQINKIPEKPCQYLLDYFNMTPHINTPFGSLSKGMKQKINLIQTFLYPCNTYLLDEPLSGLDRAAQDKLIRFIQAAKSHFIIATHHITPFLPLTPEVISL